MTFIKKLVTFSISCHEIAFTRGIISQNDTTRLLLLHRWVKSFNETTECMDSQFESEWMPVMRLGLSRRKQVNASHEAPQILNDIDSQFVCHTSSSLSCNAYHTRVSKQYATFPHRLITYIARTRYPRPTWICVQVSDSAFFKKTFSIFWPKTKCPSVPATSECRGSDTSTWGEMKSLSNIGWY